MGWPSLHSGLEPTVDPAGEKEYAGLHLMDCLLDLNYSIILQKIYNYFLNKNKKVSLILRDFHLDINNYISFTEKTHGCNMQNMIKNKTKIMTVNLLFTNNFECPL